MMHQQRKWFVASSALFCVIAAAAVAAAVPQLFAFHDATGEVATYDTDGAINTNNAFFQSLGTNGRSCATCHHLDHALSFSSAVAQTCLQKRTETIRCLPTSMERTARVLTAMMHPRTACS
jgi:ABC-type amino acid transport substrate-binding protein